MNNLCKLTPTSLLENMPQRTLCEDHVLLVQQYFQTPPDDQNPFFQAPKISSSHPLHWRRFLLYSTQTPFQANEWRTQRRNLHNLCQTPEAKPNGPAGPGSVPKRTLPFHLVAGPASPLGLPEVCEPNLDIDTPHHGLPLILYDFLPNLPTSITKTAFLEVHWCALVSKGLVCYLLLLR